MFNGNSFFWQEVEHTTEAFVAIIPDGRAWADAYNSIVITGDNKLVSDLLMTGSGALLLSSDKLEPAHSIDGTVAFLSSRWSLNYYHWMFETISRIDFLYKAGFSLDTLDKIVVIDRRFSYQKETLKTLGIPDDKIIESRNYPHIHAKKLVIPSIDQNKSMISPWACDFLRKQFLQKTHFPMKEKREIIYISRKSASLRRVINEQDVIQFLEKFGFKSICLETLSVAEQAVTFAAAKVIIAPHGAGLTNLVFCTPGTKVIEIFHPLYLQKCYWLVSNICDLTHYTLMGEVLEEKSSLGPRVQNILVNLAHLEALMKMAGI